MDGMHSNNGDKGMVKKIPYGISDYGLIRRDNHYYVDKTSFLKTIKEAGQYLFFIRPRRFGKSLLLSVMEAYYNVLYKDRFEELFKGTWIHDHPTDDRGKYLVLNFNFSAVDPDPGKLENAFLDHVQGTAVDFMQRYHNWLSTNKDMEFFTKKIKESDSVSVILSNIFLLCKGAQQRLYVIIDEYDNFANSLISTVGKKAKLVPGKFPGWFLSEVVRSRMRGGSGLRLNNCPNRDLTPLYQITVTKDILNLMILLFLTGINDFSGHCVNYHLSA